MEFVAATNNAKKLAEIRRILEKHGHTLKSLAQLGMEIEPEETGITFAENALIKATEVCRAAGLAAIADDSGLAVDALDGAPGVYSARFAGGHATDEANNQKLLHLLQDVEKKDRTARFVSVVAVALPAGATLAAEGRCEGRIGFAPAGDGGFGYDPLFLVDGKSFAQMTDAEKDAMSHRARALEQLAALLPAFLEKNTSL